MKNKVFYKSVLTVFISLFLFSCNSDKEDVAPPKEENIYLVDFRKVDKVKKYEIVVMANVLKAKGFDISFIDKIAHSVDTYVIEYNTTFQKKKIVASGLVLIPKGDKKFPLLSFQNGTNVKHSNAPSVDYKSDGFRMFNLMASTGFVISIPDYLGFGASEQMYHPYLHKKSTVQSMVDMLKAVKELANEDKVSAKLSKDVYLSGYSQGGWATMCLQKALDQDYSSEFNVKASSCGAGPYNLQTVVKTVLKEQNYHNPYFLAYVFNTMYKMGVIDQEVLGKVLNAPYAEKIPNLFDGIKSGGEINSELSSNVAELFTDSFIKNYETSDDFKLIRDFLTENSVGFWKTTIPTKLFHGQKDNDIPFATSQEASEEMKKLGVSDDILQLVPISDKGHSGAFLPTEIAALEWFLNLKNK